MIRLLDKYVYNVLGGGLRERGRDMDVTNNGYTTTITFRNAGILPYHSIQLPTHVSGAQRPSPHLHNTPFMINQTYLC
jgi:hypothetical protein